MLGMPKKQDRKKTPQEHEEMKQRTKKKKLEVTNCGQHIGILGRQGFLMTCKICGTAGHNSRTCPQNPKNQQQEQNVEVPPAEKNRKCKRKADARLATQEQNVEVPLAEKKPKRQKKSIASLATQNNILRSLQQEKTEKAKENQMQGIKNKWISELD